MLYQILRVAACAVLLCSSTINTVGKRALWNFVEAKKALQTKLGELRKMDSTADVDTSEKLVTEIQGYIDDVKKLDPKKAAEFQEILDASFEQEIGSLDITAKQTKQAAEKEVDAVADKVGQQTIKITNNLIANNANNPLIVNAANTGLLSYLAYAKAKVSWAAFPFTSLINKSYKISMRLLDFVTRGSVETIHKTYLAILEQEKDALATTIVNTSLVAALKINGFLNNVASNKNDDVTAALPPVAKYWFLGPMYDKVKGTLSGTRTKETFSGSQLHTIVIGELLEYGALLSPIVNLEDHATLKKALIEMGEHIEGIVDQIRLKPELTQDELNLACSLYELLETLKSANEDSKNILNADKQKLYPDGKLNPYIAAFDHKTEEGFNTIFTVGKIDKNTVLDTRSYLQKMQTVIAVKSPRIAAYKEEIAAVAGLALTIAGGSYLVQRYFPERLKNKYTKYIVASIDSVIGAVRGAMGGAAGVAKQRGEAALAAIRAKIPQLPFSDRIQKIFSTSYASAVAVIGSAAGLTKKLVSKVKGSGRDVVAAQMQEEKVAREAILEQLMQDQAAWGAMNDAYEGDYNQEVLQQEQMQVSSLSNVTGMQGNPEKVSNNPIWRSPGILDLDDE